MDYLCLLNTFTLPTEAEVGISKESSRILASRLSSPEKEVNLRIIDDNGSKDCVAIPGQAFRLLIDILSEMSRSNTAVVTPIHAELSVHQAAELLNVSRPFFVELLQSGEIPYHEAGGYHRVFLNDLMAYKAKTREAQSKALDELVALGQELGIGYDDLAKPGELQSPIVNS